MRRKSNAASDFRSRQMGRSLRFPERFSVTRITADLGFVRGAVGMAAAFFKRGKATAVAPTARPSIRSGELLGFHVLAVLARTVALHKLGESHQHRDALFCLEMARRQ